MRWSTRPFHTTVIATISLATALVAGGVTTARADVITFDVSGTMNPVSNAACTSTCTLGGTIMIDNSAGASNNGIVSENVTTTGFSPSVGPFTSNQGVYDVSPFTELSINDAAGNDLALVFFTPVAGSLVGFHTLSDLYTSSEVFAGNSIWSLTAAGGALSPRKVVPVPEPSSIALLLSALAGLGLAIGRRRKAG